jgi:hypothetical protein
MSFDRAVRAANLQPVDRVAQQETLDHPLLMQSLVDYDPWEHPQQAFADCYRKLDVDWVFGLPARAVKFARNESSRQGADGVRYTEWGLSGSAWRHSYPFGDIEDVLAYEPGRCLEVAADPTAGIRADQERLGEAAVVSGIFYTTLFQYPIMTFGWELFLTAAAAEPERFDRVLAGFADVSRRQLERWVAAPPPITLIHDDIALERGLVFAPEWYRRYLLPRYEYLLEPLLACPATRVAFVSDGDYTPLLDDLVALGFHGFLINDNMDLATIARRIGPDHFLIGNVSTLVLTHGTVAQVQAEVGRCLRDAAPCAGHFIKATRDLPHNIPLANIRAYFEAVDHLGRRR